MLLLELELLELTLADAFEVLFELLAEVVEADPEFDVLDEEEFPDEELLVVPHPETIPAPKTNAAIGKLIFHFLTTQFPPMATAKSIGHCCTI